MDPYGFDSGLGGSPLHGPAEHALAGEENPVGRSRLVDEPDVVLNLVVEEGRHGHHADALPRLRTGDDRFPVQDGVGLGHRHRLRLEVEVLEGEGEHLAFPESAPVEDLEAVVVHGLIHHRVGELPVLGKRPELHLGRGCIPSHGTDDMCGILGKVVVPYGIGEYAAELGVDRPQVGVLETGSPVPDLHVHDLVLPADDVLAGDLVDLALSEERDDVGVDDVPLHGQRTLLHPAAEVIEVDVLDKAAERHVQAAFLGPPGLILPLESLVLGGEAILADFMDFPLPVLLLEADSPCPAFLVFVCWHGGYLRRLCRRRSSTRRTCG